MRENTQPCFKRRNITCLNNKLIDACVLLWRPTPKSLTIRWQIFSTYIYFEERRCIWRATQITLTIFSYTRISIFCILLKAQYMVIQHEPGINARSLYSHLSTCHSSLAVFVQISVIDNFAVKQIMHLTCLE